MEVSLLPFTSMEASMEVGENFHGSKSKKWNNLVGPPRLTRRETPLLPAHTTGNITIIAATDLPLLKQQHLVTLWVSGPTSTGMLAAASWGLLKTVSSDLDVASKLRIPGRCKRASKPYVIEQSPLRPFSWYKIACVAGESGDVVGVAVVIFISTRHQHLLHSVVTLATKPSQNKYRGNSKTKREYQLPGVIRVEIFFFCFTFYTCHTTTYCSYCTCTVQ